jgi:hypothetical protein
MLHTQFAGQPRALCLFLFTWEYPQFTLLALRELRIEQVAAVESIVHKFIILQVLPGLPLP